MFNFDFKKGAFPPALGPAREYIESLQKGQAAWFEFQTALTEYQPVLMALGVKTWEVTVAKLEAAIVEKSVINPREIYDIWIESGEEAYASVVATEEYQQMQGKLSNTTMACKQYNQDVLQALLREMQLPSKQDMDSAYERIQGLTRSLKELKKEITTLKQQLDSLQLKKSTTHAK